MSWEKLWSEWCGIIYPFFVHQKENATSTKDWILDKDELEAAFSEKTRAIVINTPHNPIGKVKCYSEEVQADQKMMESICNSFVNFNLKGIQYGGVAVNCWFM